MLLKMSPQGRQKLIEREGSRLKAYQDTRGIWTIGVGHSAEAGTPPFTHRGLVITEEQVDEILTRDLVPREEYLNKLLKKTPTQNQFDAMLSLMFNIGGGAFKGSAVLHYFNEGRTLSAAEAFLHFDHPASLTRRREDEKKQFLS